MKWKPFDTQRQNHSGTVKPRKSLSKKYYTYNRLTNTLVMLRLFVCIQAPHSPSYLLNRRQLLTSLSSFLDFLIDLPIDFSSIVNVATLTWFETNFEIPKFKAHTIDDLSAHNSKPPLFDTLTQLCLAHKAI